MFYFSPYYSPLGQLYIVSNEKFLKGIFFHHQLNSLKKSFSPLKETQTQIILTTITQLNEYFAKKRTVFELPLEPDGTPFQKKAWELLLKIPYGSKISYFDQASKMNSPNAYRAVGNANGRNPIPIIIPCHRVIAKSGKWGGYSGGLLFKKKLIALEKEN